MTMELPISAFEMMALLRSSFILICLMVWYSWVERSELGCCLCSCLMPWAVMALKYSWWWLGSCVIAVSASIARVEIQSFVYKAGCI